MARVTHVKKAQQRYKMVPVLDEGTGEQKRVPKMRGGKQIVSKRGPVWQRLTVADKSKPLPLRTCDHCRKPIELGTPYKHISPKSGPYGGRTMYRHEGCPTWQVWEYSYSMGAQISRIQFEYDEAASEAGSEDDLRAALDTASEEVRSLADEKRQSAENIREGFGHDTYQSEELDDIAEQLEGWADEIADVDLGDAPTEEEGFHEWDDPEANGDPDELDGGDPPLCALCGGTPDDHPLNDDGEDFDTVLDGWLDGAKDEAQAAVENCPV